LAKTAVNLGAPSACLKKQNPKRRTIKKSHSRKGKRRKKKGHLDFSQTNGILRGEKEEGGEKGGSRGERPVSERLCGLNYGKSIRWGSKKRKEALLDPKGRGGETGPRDLDSLVCGLGEQGS